MDGQDIHPAQRAVELDIKQELAHVPTQLHLEAEVSAADCRIIQEAVTLIHAE